MSAKSLRHKGIDEGRRLHGDEPVTRDRGSIMWSSAEGDSVRVSNTTAP